MKRVMMLLGIALVVMCIKASGAAAAGPQYCYECVQRQGYMDCMHPVPSGHQSCVPYTTNCLVGAQCGSALQQFRVTPDGSYLNSMLLDTELAMDAAADAAQLHAEGLSGEEAVKNCIGLVAARHYTPTRALEIEAQTASMVL